MLTKIQLIDMKDGAFHPANSPVVADGQGGLVIVNEETRYVFLEPFSYVGEVECASGSSRAYMPVPPELDQASLTYVRAMAKTAGITGTMSIMVYNETQAVEMLSTPVSVDSNDTDSNDASTPPVIKSNGDEVVFEGDLVRLDFQDTQAIPARGCIFIAGFR